MCGFPPRGSRTASSGGSRVARPRTGASSSCDATRTARGPTSSRPGFNVRTSVHEYGGGAYCIHGGVAFVSNFDDQRLYRIDPERRSRSDHARHRGQASPLCGRSRHGGRFALDRRARATRGERQLEGRRQRARRPADRRIRRAPRGRRRSRLLLESAHLGGRLPSLLPRLESAVDAVGRVRAARRRTVSGRRCERRRARRGRGRRGIDLAAGVEPVGRSRLRERSKRLVEPRADSWRGALDAPSGRGRVRVPGVGRSGRARSRSSTTGGSSVPSTPAASPTSASSIPSRGSSRSSISGSTRSRGLRTCAQRAWQAVIVAGSSTIPSQIARVDVATGDGGDAAPQRRVARVRRATSRSHGRSSSRPRAA